MIFLASSLHPLAQDKYFVSFKDKANSAFSVQHPEEFLSERAINRRIKQEIEIIELDIPVNKNYLEQIQLTGAKVLYPLKWLNGAVISINHPIQLETIMNFDFVTGVKSVYYSNQKKIGAKVDSVSTSVIKPKNSVDIYDYGQSASQIIMLKGNILHNNGFQGQGLVIAVLDAGFYHVNTLESFYYLRNSRILGTKDFVNPQSNIYNEHTHGTMVLSVMAGYLSGQLIGTAPEASYWLIRTEDAGSEQLVEEYNWIAGAEFADSVGADVINTSLGYTTFDVEAQNHSYQNMDGNTTPISVAAEIASKRGMVVVVSAGNEGSGTWKYISAPADANGILTVGAVTLDRIRSSFSSIGPSYDGRVKPDVVAMGSSTVVQSPYGGIGIASGTSLSAPVISGLVACLWQAHAELNSSEIIDLIKKSSSTYNSPNFDIGYGIPDFSLALNGEQDLREDKNSLSLKPNPFYNRIKLITSNKHDGEIAILIYSLGGFPILSIDSKFTDGECDLEIPLLIPPGLYIIQINSKSKTWSSKLIKIEP